MCFPPQWQCKQKQTVIKRFGSRNMVGIYPHSKPNMIEVSLKCITKLLKFHICGENQS